MFFSGLHHSVSHGEHRCSVRSDVFKLSRLSFFISFCWMIVLMIVEQHPHIVVTFLSWRMRVKGREQIRHRLLNRSWKHYELHIVNTHFSCSALKEEPFSSSKFLCFLLFTNISTKHVNIPIRITFLLEQPWISNDVFYIQNSGFNHWYVVNDWINSFTPY